MRPTKVRRHDREEPGRLRVAAHNLGEPMAVRPRVWCCRILQKTGKSLPPESLQAFFLFDIEWKLLAEFVFFDLSHFAECGVNCLGTNSKALFWL